MHHNILSDKQNELLPLISVFKRSFYLVGGTAISLHNLLSLSAMKAYALGRRAKWKDYVDLYHDDIDYSENVEFMQDIAVSNDAIKAFLIDKSIEF